MIYTATAEEMQEYAQLVAALTHADLQRQQCIDAIGRWEQAHGAKEPEIGRPAEDQPAAEPAPEAQPDQTY